MSREVIYYRIQNKKFKCNLMLFGSVSSEMSIFRFRARVAMLLMQATGLTCYFVSGMQQPRPLQEQDRMKSQESTKHLRQERNAHAGQEGRSALHSASSALLSSTSRQQIDPITGLEPGHDPLHRHSVFSYWFWAEHSQAAWAHATSMIQRGSSLQLAGPQGFFAKLGENLDWTAFYVYETAENGLLAAGRWFGVWSPHSPHMQQHHEENVFSSTAPRRSLAVGAKQSSIQTRDRNWNWGKRLEHHPHHLYHADGRHPFSMLEQSSFYVPKKTFTLFVMMAAACLPAGLCYMANKRYSDTNEAMLREKAMREAAAAANEVDALPPPTS
ncbi:unnamed protein product [Amoebophrya sp. A25]|nr:unnamed protein product [Amoebophrya sp. A25]|eukprot:GSA25T00007551001.1